MKKKILFLTDKYFPIPYANGNCVHQVAKTFLEMGWETHILAYQDDNMPLPEVKDNIKVFGVKTDIRLKFFYKSVDDPNKYWTSLFKLLGRGFSLLGRLLHWREYPITSKLFINRIETKLEKLYELNHYDIIISTYNPIESVVAGLYFKKKHKDVIWGIYNLDYMPQAIIRHISKKKLEKSCRYWEEQFFAYADFTLVIDETYKLDCERRNYYSRYSGKIIITDIPLMKKGYKENESSKEDLNDFYLDPQVENWVYAGAMESSHYNPEKAFDVFLKLDDGKKRVFHIFGRGDLMPLCKKYEEQTRGKILCHDYVPHDQLVRIFDEADYLVSIKTTRFLSGKVAEYISTGKRIIHFSDCKDDADSKYFSKYSRGFIVNTYLGSTQENKELLQNKLEKWDESDSVPNFEAFKMNYPQYTRDVILEKYKMLKEEE